MVFEAGEYCDIGIVLSVCKLKNSSSHQKVAGEYCLVDIYFSDLCRLENTFLIISVGLCGHSRSPCCHACVGSVLPE